MPLEKGIEKTLEKFKAWGYTSTVNSNYKFIQIMNSEYAP